jgi:hypothetical protein
MSEWESIDDHTDRMKVPGGWIVRLVGDTGVAMCFVQDVHHVWRIE